ncbi:MAG TPA: Fic/DOC family N-terminal domain-containing protein [Candidatus Cloacimonadota bacterium]|mgnify:CR=1|jgi:Fic family protein|nr:Fic/DOC family N-terminal domain-containing protein [Candidatus Cloacimonadales bacterium]HPY96447.1 Fic/DOC family N-terminal domain-containing protein [Candidatus Cloacimonadota bacterium]HQB41943.1 Fic/DOC family N-terminal domain-containing protein [Candidatus Cloacimonadota bacterium]
MKKIKPDQAHNSLPLLPPDYSFNSEHINKQLIKTHKALAELKGYARNLPNISILLNLILLQEAKDSSEIENIITSHDDLYRAISIKDYKATPQAKEVLKYRQALYTGYEMIKDKQMITNNMIIKIQEIIEDNSAGFRKLPGTVLKRANNDEILFTPPDNVDDIIRLMKNYEAFLNDDTDEIDPLIKLAIQHYQFEAIHPFYDGNGRTGRVINMLYLVLKGILNEPFLYLSSFIIKNKSEYYRLLRNVTYNNTWDDWIIFILAGIEETALNTLDISYKIIDSIEKSIDMMKANYPKIYSRELVELLYSNMYTKISDLVNNGIASRNIASQYLKQLEPTILTSEKVGREILFVNKEIRKLLSTNLK